MKISFKIEDVAARAFGLTTIEEFTALANGSLTVDTKAAKAGETVTHHNEFQKYQ